MAGAGTGMNEKCITLFSVRVPKSKCKATSEILCTCHCLTASYPGCIPCIAYAEVASWHRENN